MKIQSPEVNQESGFKNCVHDSAIQFFLQIFYSFIFQVFVVSRKPVDNSFGSDFDYAVGYSLHKLVIMCCH